MNQRLVPTILPIVLLLAAAGCKGKPPEEPAAATAESPAQPAAETAKPAEAPKPAEEKPAVADEKPAAAAAAGANPLLDPAAATEQAPDSFKVKFTTSKGDFVVEVHREWAPKGADRFYNLVKLGYFTDARFFRAIDGFMVQFGINGDPAVNDKWREARINDDPVKQSNKRGYVTFATSGPNSRTTQLFINFGDNANLDAMGFSPFGKVADGMTVVDSVFKGYGEGAPSGAGPNQARIQREGNAYLNTEFPKLDFIKEAKVL